MTNFKIELDPVFEEELKKIEKNDKASYTKIVKQILKLSQYPYYGKPLKNVLKGKWRVHIGHFVLTYEIDEKNKIVKFLKYEHHDKAY